MSSALSIRCLLWTTLWGWFIVLAGGYPCCCDVQPISGSTQPHPPSGYSTAGPPFPPLPPRGSSVSEFFPLPPKKSSSVGAIQRLDCSFCKLGELLADQWQIEITGIANQFCSTCTNWNGAYVIDGISTTSYVQALDNISGCGSNTGGNNLVGFDDCGDGTPDANDGDVSLLFGAAWEQQVGTDRGYGTEVVLVIGNAVNPLFYVAKWRKYWYGPDVDPLDDRQVPCATQLPGTVLPIFSEEDLGGRCNAASSTATVYEVEGF